MKENSIDLHKEMLAIGNKALKASREMALLGARKKNAILLSMADAIDESRDKIKSENAVDIEAGRAAGLSAAMLDRLLLDDRRIDAMSKGLRSVAGLKDPIGQRISRWIRPNGLEIIKRRVPIGVIAIIYESRPDVTADAASLCIKASNAVILRGGKEAIRSNIAIADALCEGGRRQGLPENAIQLVKTTSRDAIREIVRLEGLVDLAIPRGGEALIRTVTENATIPVIKHYKGVCHIYVDESADFEMALNVIENAKCQRPGVCNAVEKVLVNAKIAGAFLPLFAERMKQRKVEVRGDSASKTIIPWIKDAVEADWYAEYLDLIIAVRVVQSVEEAVDHINKYGSHHSDAIITESERARRIFTDRVDSAVVYVNASTRFTDGGEFGMGGEIGISTDKFHARGPMGIEELTTYKYVVLGDGQTRQ